MNSFVLDIQWVKCFVEARIPLLIYPFVRELVIVVQVQTVIQSLTSRPNMANTG